MLEANSCFVEMWELQKRTGAIVAEVCGAEAGWITPGAHAALVLSAAKHPYIKTISDYLSISF